MGTKNVDGWNVGIHVYPTLLFVCSFVLLVMWVGIIVGVHCMCVLFVKPRIILVPVMWEREKKQKWHFCAQIFL